MVACVPYSCRYAVRGIDTQLSMLLPNIFPCASPTPITVYGEPSTRISLPRGSPAPSMLSTMSAPTMATCAECSSSASVNERPSTIFWFEIGGNVHVHPRIVVSVDDAADFKPQ